MTQKISDLTATDRLRTGTQFETQDPSVGSDYDTVDDLLVGPNWDTPSQVAGYTSANIMEVEAKYLAARMRLCPDEVNYPQAGWQIGRYLYSQANFTYPSNAAAFTNSKDFTMMWTFTGGIMIPKKITGTIVVGARTAGQAGAADISLWRMYGITIGIETPNNTVITMASPPAAGKTQTGPTGLATPLGTGGLVTKQPPSLARLDDNTTMAAMGYFDPFPFATVIGSAKAAAGSTPLQNVVLYDYMVAEQPLVLAPGTGIQMTYSLPGGTATSHQVWLNVQWDEWTMMPDR